MRSMPEWRKVEVVEIADVADDVRAVTFVVEGDVPEFDPGSHTQIRIVINGLGATRTYTVLPSRPGTLRIAVKLHPNSRGGSAFVWSLKPGDRTEMMVPENRFELSWRSPYCLLVAGGIGITPIYGMAKALAARNHGLRLIYGGNSRGQMAFADELSALLGDRMQTFVQDHGEAFDLDAEIGKMPADGEIYVCGPLGLLNAVRDAWARSGRPASRLRYEVFGDSGQFNEMPFAVEIPALDRLVEVRSDQSLLEALIQSGVDMVYDCQRGECGLCAIDVLRAEGQIDHRDVFFSPAEKAENSRMCACVSRLVGGTAVIDTGYRDGV
jgi:ferredoxin-NADP reductase